MTKEEKKRILNKLISESEWGTKARLARVCGVKDPTIYDWLKPGGSWPTAEREPKVWEFFGYTLKGQKLVRLTEDTLTLPMEIEKRAEELAGRVKRLVLKADPSVNEAMERYVSALEQLDTPKKRVSGTT